MNEKYKFGFRRVENIGKEAFSPFPTMFSKALSFRVIKSWDCVLTLDKLCEKHLTTIILPMKLTMILDKMRMWDSKSFPNNPKFCWEPAFSPFK